MHGRSPTATTAATTSRLRSSTTTTATTSHLRSPTAATTADVQPGMRWKCGLRERRVLLPGRRVRSRTRLHTTSRPCWSSDSSGRRAIVVVLI